MPFCDFSQQKSGVYRMFQYTPEGHLIILLLFSNNAVGNYHRRIQV